MSEPVLQIKNLRTYFHLREGLAKAVDGISYGLHRSETLGLVGESGCGKTVSSLSILKLLDVPPAEFRSGEILFERQDLLRLPEKELRKIRGKSISMIFQEPMTSLNPVLPIGLQIGEVLTNHRDMSNREARERTRELLRMVGLPSPQRRLSEYPHQLSGGMRQRVMIAMALACDPKVLIADEPTTALDVTIQAQILDLMVALQESLGTSILLITHDLGVVKHISTRVAVMYLGMLCELASTADLFQSPMHPYTQLLIESIPSIKERKPLKITEGLTHDLRDPPPGCAFQLRCPHVMDRCREVMPSMLEVRPDHQVACYR